MENDIKYEGRLVDERIDSALIGKLDIVYCDPHSLGDLGRILVRGKHGSVAFPTEDGRFRVYIDLNAPQESRRKGVLEGLFYLVGFNGSEAINLAKQVVSDPENYGGMLDVTDNLLDISEHKRYIPNTSENHPRNY